MSIIGKLNSLAKEHTPFKRTIFTDEFLKDWQGNSSKLLERYDSIEESSEKDNLIYDIFNEAMVFTNKEFKDLLNDDYGMLGEFLSKLCEKNSQANPRMLANIINYFPRSLEDDSNVIALIGAIRGVDFEFSASLVEKLLTHRWTKEQTSLYKRNLISEKYHLKKYNLLFECAPGFSQICSLLHVAYSDKDRFQSLKYYWNQMQFIAGKYTLDPIRVLDVVLRISSIYIHNHYDFLLDLLKVSDYWPHEISDPFDWNKLNYGGNVVASRLIAYKLSNEKFDHKYMDMVCILIKEGFISYISIFEALRPDEETVQTYVEEYYADLEKQSSEGVLNPLAMAAALPDEDETSAPAANGEQKSDGQVNVKKEKERQEQREEKERKNRHYRVKRTGKWRLVTSCLNHGLLFPALYSIKKNEKVALSIDALVEACIRIFDYMIQPLYEQAINAPKCNAVSRVTMKMSNSGLPSKEPRLIHEYVSPNVSERFLFNVKYSFYYTEWTDKLPVLHNIEDLFRYSHQILGLLGPRLSVSSSVITKLNSIAVHDIESSNNSEDTIEMWINYFRKFIFPAIAAIEDDFVPNLSAYELMKRFPFEKRYFLYNEMYTKTSNDNVFVRLAFNKVGKRIKTLLKSLSIDDIADKVNDVSRIVSSNPLAALGPIVNQIENYDKVSELVVISANKFPKIAYDILQYVLLLKLTSGRNLLQSDGINQNTWIQRLSVFIAGLAKSCPEMDLTNILTFLVKSLHKNRNVSFPVLKELISKVGGIQNLNHVSSQQLQMLNSGPSLQKVARSLILDTRQDTFEAARAITQVFVKLNAITELIVMLCNLNISNQSDDIHYKILSTKCDDSNSLLWTLIEMLKHTLSLEEFVSNVLPFYELVNDYNVPIEWSFHIWRDFFDEKIHEGDESMKQIDEIIEKTEFKYVSFENLNKELFTNFWKLSLYDVQFNKALYDKTTSALNSKLNAVKLQRERNSIMNDVQEVMSNCLAHQRAFKQIQELLQGNKEKWLPELNAETNQAFFQFCILPRTLFSSADAIYSALFIVELCGIQNSFSIFKFFVDSHILGGLLFSCTVTESANMGFFTNVLLNTFEKARSEGVFDNCSLEEIYRLHSIMIGDLTGLLAESNYMSIRNSIEFLNQISHKFPVVDEHIKELCHSLEYKLVGDNREDIRLPCNALIGHLKSRLKNASRKQDFYELPEEELLEIRKLDEERMLIKKYQESLAQEDEAKKLEEESKMNILKPLDDRVESRYMANTGEADSTDAEKTKQQSEAVSCQLHQILDNMDQVLNLLRTESAEEAPRFIRVVFFKNEFKKVINDYKGDLEGFRKNIANILVDYFYSMVQWPQSNPTFVQKARDIKTACLKCNAPISKATKIKVMADDLYGEDIASSWATNPKAARTNRESRFAGAKPVPNLTSDTSTSNENKWKTERVEKTAIDTRNTSRYADEDTKSSTQTKKDDKPSGSRFNNGKVPVKKPVDNKQDQKPSNSLRNRVGSRFEGRQENSTRFSGPRADPIRFPTAPARHAEPVNESRFRNMPKELSRKRAAEDYRYGDSKRQRQEDDNRRKPTKETRGEQHPTAILSQKKGGFSRFR
ncbi:Tho2p Ecym_6378 [Eremothecium cymbalariae DBVPG|uniref:THO complex subunit 2 n=1 Tax=Eremothecium cymbalariae (strain CBS 270.75 / DBVPG 7215 / KCTC 17166 / NRRL Y-17582) TaxID=931890 RepID=G8JUH3_ERECY|nr:hypothetical protein Ecym_6378 [Eremothecium cymbalariae DBVPG\